ncbi:MAG: DUF815 domain-containing protein [Candidatus Micrarchaeota archaeon]|nr:DUF815 domain-containing protein [Candidatus Micrarchaeota archaeon]
MLWLKYAPKTLEEYVGNDIIKKRLQAWIKNFKRGIKGKPILLVGKPGSGKTSLVYALAGSEDLEVVEINLHNLIDPNTINPITLEGKRVLLLVDDVDALLATTKGFSLDFLKNPKVPIILTANDYWAPSMAKIRSLVQAGYVDKLDVKLSKKDMLQILKRIVEKEKIPIDEAELKRIVELNEGDVRAAINDLETKFAQMRDRKPEIFKILAGLFGNNFRRALLAANSIDLADLDQVMLWVDENIPNRYLKPWEAYRYLSLADLYYGRIQSRQYWKYLNYVKAFLAMLSLVKDRNPHPGLFQSPRWLYNLARLRAERELRHSIAKKLAKRLHISTKKALGSLREYILTSDGSFLPLTDEEQAYWDKIREKSLKVLKQTV